MSKTSNSNWETTVKPIVVLSVISLVVSLLLALVNSMTAPVIAENTKRTTLAAYVGVLPSVSDATELEEVTGYTTANVTGVVKAPDGSLAIKAEESGFDGGIVTVIVGMDANGTETGIWVDASTQTKGIGSAVAEDDFLKQFDGLDCTQSVVQAFHVGLHEHLHDGHEACNDDDVAGQMHLAGDHLAQQGDHDVGAHQHEGERSAHAQSTGHGGGDSQRGAGTQNQTQNGVLFDDAVGKDAYLGLLFLCHFLPTSFMPARCSS